MIKYLCVLVFLIFTSTMALAQDYWVDYKINEFVRMLPSDPWQPRFSSPFGVRVGYGGGITLREPLKNSVKEYSCFSFSFEPKSANGMASLSHHLQAKEYVGNIFCEPQTPQINVLADIDLLAVQNGVATFEFPYINNTQWIRIELSQTWHEVTEAKSIGNPAVKEKSH